MSHQYSLNRVRKWDIETDGPFKEKLIDVHDGWSSIEVWQTIKTHSPAYTSGYFLNAVDMRKTAQGAEFQPDDKTILIKLFKRTFVMSLVITFSCILLGYPVAWLLANLPMRQANFLMIRGFGRTGNWFGSQTLNIRPDIMTIAKGLSSGYQPIGGSIVSTKIANVIGKDEFNHGYTYSSHPVAAAVALANLNIIESEGLVERVRNDTAPYLAKKWATLMRSITFL